ncbi:MAG: DUF2442 domain-containing protein [bacterium]
MQRVVLVRPLDGYRLSVQFADGTEGEVDLSDLVGKGVFAAWVDRERFLEVAIDPETGALAWPGGIDLCPDSLYEEVTGRVFIARDERADPA